MTVRTVRAVFDPKLLVDLHPFSSTEDVRYYLNGVAIQRSPFGVMGIATDGIVMAGDLDPDGMTNENLIVRVAPETLRAMKKCRLDQMRRVVINDHWLHLVDIDDISKPSPEKARNAAIAAVEGATRAIVHSQADCLIVGSFPSWERAIPTSFRDGCKPVPGVAFDPKMLARFAHLKDDQLELHFTSGDGPALVLSFSRPSFLGLVMPLKPFDSFKLSEWVLAMMPKPEPASEPAI